jgi:phosphohistidine phosphatase
MQQLVLFRHAKATPADDESQDFQRALAPQGRADAPRIAALLAAAGAAPEIVLVSEARRTRETWELAEPSFPMADVRFVQELYLAPAETLMEHAVATGASRVMVIAHNPGLQDLALQLCPPRSADAVRLQRKFPTSAAILFSRTTAKAGWKVGCLLTPADSLD